MSARLSTAAAGGIFRRNNPRIDQLPIAPAFNLAASRLYLPAIDDAGMDSRPDDGARSDALGKPENIVDQVAELTSFEQAGLHAAPSKAIAARANAFLIAASGLP